MPAAAFLRDRIVAHIDDVGFVAHGLHVRDGDDTAAHRWVPDAREDMHSAAKGICVIAAGIAAGIAADDGLIDLDAPVAEYVPGFSFGDGADAVTMRHLLSMTSGIELPWSEDMMTRWPDLAREFFSRPSRGRVFQYSNASTYAAMTVLATRVGDVHDYLVPRLFAPLGIHDVTWDRCPNGRIIAGEGIALRTEELARIGLLIRDRGRWKGAQIVSPQWIDAMHTGWVRAGKNPGYQRYALAGWDGPGPAWRLHGAHGKLLIFIDDDVVTLTAHDHFAADAVVARIVELVAGETAV